MAWGRGGEPGAVGGGAAVSTATTTRPQGGGGGEGKGREGRAARHPSPDPPLKTPHRRFPPPWKVGQNGTTATTSPLPAAHPPPPPPLHTPRRHHCRHRSVHCHHRRPTATTATTAHLHQQHHHGHGNEQAHLAAQAGRRQPQRRPAVAPSPPPAAAGASPVLGRHRWGGAPGHWRGQPDEAGGWGRCCTGRGLRARGDADRQREEVRREGKGGTKRR